MISVKVPKAQMTIVEGIAQMKCILHTLVEYYLPIAARMMKTTKFYISSEAVAPVIISTNSPVITA